MSLRESGARHTPAGAGAQQAPLTQKRHPPHPGQSRSTTGAAKAKAALAAPRPEPEHSKRRQSKSGARRTPAVAEAQQAPQKRATNIAYGRTARLSRPDAAGRTGRSRASARRQRSSESGPPVGDQPPTPRQPAAPAQPSRTRPSTAQPAQQRACAQPGRRTSSAATPANRTAARQLPSGARARPAPQQGLTTSEPHGTRHRAHKAAAARRQLSTRVAASAHPTYELGY
ncbi:serine/arginine repetitive matrix protein 1-like [Schistocerca nitens]|uniref:serine/arginine repetitive matrix protein 1-like n=1 Tax=Schistocerca nitens TaxID=7011 RepID=UPI002118D28B|nr:serine/arginine repetitive matrix protein 1-like [Schistocerca nitens]